MSASPSTNPVTGRGLLGILAALFLVRVGIVAASGLVNDEAYYWQWSRHLAWGYYDHPPMVAYGIALGRALFGDTQLGVRFATVALSTASMAISFDLGRLYGGDRRSGWWTAGISAVVPLLAAGGVLATPDVPLVCFWTATLALVARALARPRMYLWLAAGATLGLGGLSKYTMVLLLPGLIAALLMMPRGRAALRTPSPYLGAGVALAICAPWIHWTLTTGTHSVAHSLSKGFAIGGGKAVANPLQSLAEFIGVQALLVTPILFVLALWSLIRGMRAIATAWGRVDAADSGGDFEGRELLPLLVIPALLPLLVFAGASLFSESYPNWPAPAYATMFVLLGAELAHGDLLQRRRKWIVAGFVIPALATLHVYIEAVHPMVPYPKGAMTKVRDREGLTSWAQGVRESRGEPGVKAAVLAGGYQIASILAFYLPDHPETDAPFERRGGSQYRIWRAERPADAKQPEFAWFFTTLRGNQSEERAHELLEHPELVDSYTQTRLGQQLRTVHAYFGRRTPPRRRADRRRGEGSATGDPPAAGRWRRHVTATPPGALSAEEREMLARLEAIGYASGSEPAPTSRGVTVHDAARAYRGLNFYTSGHAPEAQLMDMDGRQLWSWSYDFAEAFPDFELPRRHRGDAHWRRAHLFPNGDLLAIYDGFGMIKLDRDSKLIWTFSGRPHHDLDVDENGDIYVLTREVVRKPEINPTRLVLDDFVVVLNADGEELRRVSILEAYRNSPFADELSRMDRSGDLFHTNTIEILRESSVGRPEAGGAAPFRPGNVLISLLQMDTIAVIDLEAGSVVWSMRGGWSRQHQPTFTGPNRLLIFDNQRDTRRNSSRVIEFDAQTHEVLWEYSGERDGPLRSKSCGSVQRLPNGNTLVTESDNGRAFELVPDKEIVWEWISPHRAGDDGEFIATLFDLVRLDPSFPTDWIRVHSR